MTGTPEEDLLGWLEREEKELGFTDVGEALTDLEKARALFYGELGYDMTEKQFAGLVDARFTRYIELPAVNVSYVGGMQFRDKAGRFTTRELAYTSEYLHSYRDTITKRFISGEDAFARVKAAR